MTRRLTAAVAIVCAVAVITAPTAATHQLVDASTHTTTSEFNNAAVLSNVTVANDAVSLSDGSAVTDGFESESADSGVPDEWEESSDAQSGASEYNVTTSRSNAGSQSAFVGIDSGGDRGAIRPANQPISAQTDYIKYEWFPQREDVSGASETATLKVKESGTEVIRLVVRSGDLKYWDGNSYTTITTSVDWSEWSTINITSIDPANNQYDVEWSEAGGNSGTATDLSMVNGMSSGYTETSWYVADSEMFIDEVDIGGTGPAAQGQYISDTHQVGNASQGLVNLNLANASATVEWQYQDSNNNWQVGASSSYTSGGNKTLNLPDVSSSEWRVNVTFDRLSGTTNAELNYDVVRFKPDDPTLSNVSPPDGANLTTEGLNMSADVSDPDFGRPQGDSVTVEWYVDGNLVDQQSVNANGTYYHEETGLTGGDHTYHIDVSDSYGHSDSSTTRTVYTPAELGIYNETSPQTLIKGPNQSVEIEFYFESGGQDTIVARNTSDGTLNMTGLPADQPFVVVADTPGYVSRRIFIRDLYNQQSVYLLNETTHSHEDVVFKIQDYSGEFPQGVSTLQVQRSINESWQTVEGDFFGANGEFSAQLHSNQRHRLVMYNTDTGARRVLGTFTPLVSEEQTVTVSPEEGIVTTRATALRSLAPATSTLPARQVPFNVSVQAGPGTTFATWNVSIYAINETANTNTSLFQHDSISDDGGTVRPSLDLSNRANETLLIITRYETSGGISDTKRVRKQIIRTYGQQTSLLDSLSGLITLVPPANQGVFAGTLALVLVVLITAGVASVIPMPTEMVGAVALLSIAGFAVIGWLGYDLLFVGTVAWLSVTFLRRRY